MTNQNPPIAHELLSHQAFLRRLAIDLVGEDADELVQEVWQRALERPPHHGRQLRGWVARVARNLAANRWRGEARRTEREERRAQEQSTANELEARFELRKELVAALDSLSPSIRATILLRYFEGLAPREIARRQGTPLATVKTRLRRGLAQLREALDQRSGGDRATWMSAVVALGAPLGDGTETGTLVLGGLAMGTMAKVSAAALVVTVGVYLVTRPGQSATPPPTATLPATAEELVEPADLVAAENLGDNAKLGSARRNAVVEESVSVTPAATEANVLRVIIEGISEEDARTATVTASGLDKRDGWPMEIGASWPSQGLTSEFDLDRILASLERFEHLRPGQLEIAVDHPHFLGERTRISLASDAVPTNGKSVHEVRVLLVQPEYWPELTLTVRDAYTRAHLEDVEIRIASGPGMAAWGRNETGTLLGDGLTSPIALMGGRDASEPEHRVAGMALSPAAGESPHIVELARRWRPERGVRLSARAPGYAWGSTGIDVSKGERELLLEPSGRLGVRLANMQLARYAALETVPMLCVYRIREDGGNQYAHFERLDASLETEGLWLDSLRPGGYRLVVELGGGSWTEQPVLAREEVSIVVGETREVVLMLDEPPEPPARANLGGVVSFPASTASWAEEKVRLQFYFQPTQRWMKPDFEFPLADLQRVGGELPSWSFRLEDLPVGMYRVQLMPFLKAWMIDLQADGAEDLELVLPELAEVLVETVDGRTGERVPRNDLYFRALEPAPGQRQRDLAKADTEEAGRFRFWTAPESIRIWPKFPNGAEREFGGNGMDLELVPGFQSVKYEFEPVYAMHFEFREDGTALPTGPMGMHTTKDIRAIDHEGRVTDGGLQRDMRVEVSEPGAYEIRFERVTGDRYHPIPPRVVNVRAGETTEVIVELRRK